MTFTVSDLRALRLTSNEWNSLMHMGEAEPVIDDMHMLVLAGLARRVAVRNPHDDTDVRWLDEWDLTDAGRAACNAIDMIFDWDTFALACDEDETESFTEIIKLGPVHVPMFV